MSARFQTASNTDPLPNVANGLNEFAQGWAQASTLHAKEAETQSSSLGQYLQWQLDSSTTALVSVVSLVCPSFKIRNKRQHIFFCFTETQALTLPPLAFQHLMGKKSSIPECISNPT